MNIINNFILACLVLVCAALTVTGCNTDENGHVEDDLRLRHKGADMPVFVRGNLASGKMILFLHGGPGDCAMCYRHYLEPVEKEYAIAYWDQRVAGTSSGNVDISTLSYAQFLEDTELVVGLLKQEYPATDIYLLGHSFGVELGWQFLTAKENQKQVAGFIAVNGIYSSYEWLNSMRDFVIEKAQEQNNQEALQFANTHVLTHETILEYPWTELYSYMYELNGNPVSVYSDASFLLDYFFSPNYLFAQFTHGNYFSEVVNTDGLLFEKENELLEITIPVGLFWGRKDGIVPFENALKTESLLLNAEVKLVRFDESWHEPFITEPKKFTDQVVRFLDEY